MDGVKPLPLLPNPYKDQSQSEESQTQSLVTAWLEAQEDTSTPALDRPQDASAMEPPPAILSKLLQLQHQQQLQQQALQQGGAPVAPPVPTHHLMQLLQVSSG